MCYVEMHRLLPMSSASHRLLSASVGEAVTVGFGLGFKPPNPSPLAWWHCIFGCSVGEYLCYKAFVRHRMSLYDGVLGAIRHSVIKKPIADSTGMLVLESVGCEPLLGGSRHSVSFFPSYLIASQMVQ